ncbi:PKD domain containing protein [Allomuricauda ruestringensis DSM 13258]|uniref:PKD domain containing protein n=1 Tax=Allomuricauda ruestringensis (strain DSM 13258 / CIP 107369 / LMG 19739 / B1) TaxID=886377 RepID=G2PJN9_ALLRU|nr:T9SS type B sorting domain-containing protein [Allomuricauda ruestringensis]AEM69797.1 PKD domain containing protein [Allomuricauda ruestringensis DSM 13258]
MHKQIIPFVFLISFQLSIAQITLTHNTGNSPVPSDMYSCDYEEIWARAFRLSDFGITINEQFIINSGQVAISNSYDGAMLVFSIYSIDSNFPNSEPKRVSYGNVVTAPEIGDTPEIVQIEFANPVVVPANVERILVEVSQMDDIYNDDFKKIKIAGNQFDDGSPSYFRGCRQYYSFVSTEDLATPVPNANFFINVTGEALPAQSTGGTTVLSHSVCEDFIDAHIFGCSSGGMSWSRDFWLEDFGISTEEEFILERGQVGINYAGWGVEIQFRVYAIDDNFPTSFSDTDLLGSSELIRIPNFGTSNLNTPRIFDVEFDTPIIIPANAERILVEVFQTNNASYPTSTIEDDGAVSWIKSYHGGCYPLGEFVDVKDLGYPDAKFFINVTGDVDHVTNNFDMDISNICLEFLKEFGVVPNTNVASVTWDFGDPASGVENTSTDISPFHDFSADGVYTVNATVTDTNGNMEVITETIDVKEPPNAYGINDIYACEDNFNTGISSTFDVSNVRQQVLGGQNNKVVTFIDGAGNEYDVLPNPFTNTVANRETITVRVAHDDNPCCFSETTFDLITNPVLDLTSVSDLVVCSNETDGFAFFDLQQLRQDILDVNGSVDISFYHENGNQIQEPLGAVENLVVNEEVITVRAIEPTNNCYNETTFKIMAHPLPTASTLNTLVGCDDNNDGISEYFDTSNIESEVVGNQANIVVSYFDASGTPLPSPLPNPYTNILANEETITVRVTNELTNCFEETPLLLRTATQPQISSPQPIYACDQGNGFAQFVTAGIEAEIIGNQTGLTIKFYNDDGEQLPNPLPDMFQNMEAWQQTIHVLVENELNDSCSSETSLDLIVQELPMVNLDSSYFLCNLEPFLPISVASGWDNYNWMYEDGSIISTTYEANLTEAGKYTLLVGVMVNGIFCENSYEFELIRSMPPTITDVSYQQLSDNNSIEITASGDGDFEYSIDGVNFKDSHIFTNLIGGKYTVFVRDKNGCGEDSEEIVVIDYPKFFTPNHDGYNDFWHILGIDAYPNADVLIFDRYGKLLKQLSSSDIGWDGTYNGDEMMSNDYWFKSDLGNGTVFSGHFTLKR